MENFKENYKLSIYIGEDDKYKGESLYEHIISYADKNNIKRATCLRGIMGFGRTHKLHSSKFLRLFDNMPIKIEIIDKKENINKILPYIEKILDNGFLSIEKSFFKDIQND